MFIIFFDHPIKTYLYLLVRFGLFASNPIKFNDITTRLRASSFSCYQVFRHTKTDTQYRTCITYSITRFFQIAWQFLVILCLECCRMHMALYLSHQLQDKHPMLVQCWASVADAGPTLNQHRIYIPCFLAYLTEIDVCHHQEIAECSSYCSPLPVITIPLLAKYRTTRTAKCPLSDQVIYRSNICPRFPLICTFNP